ncbi:unnamed protein product [Paramecium primaurelia]|uniref:MORN repeat protein n=1 Tax=Paramecium primaurelia TaxID=5886 RepID=A0A8S1NG07_PARPR|nr:unnamed protein product [Paramecium primaurelia]
MGNCQQCTNFGPSNQTTEIRSKSTKPKHTLKFTNKFTHQNIKGIIRIQAAFKGYMARKQFSLLSTQQKYNSPIFNHDIMIQDTFSNTDDCPNQPQYLIMKKSMIQDYLKEEEEINQKFAEVNQQCQSYCNKDIPDNQSQISEGSPLSSLKKQFSFDMTSLCFIPKSKNDRLLTLTQSQIKLPIIQMINGAYYEGQWNNGKANGFGKYVMIDNSSYVGEWVNNQANGFGTFQLMDGEFFRGHWIQNVVEGQGKYTFVDGTFYEGEWKNDLPNGIGVQTYSNGWKYEGSFLNGIKNGQGILRFPDGSIYEGFFERDVPQGMGTLIFQDGRNYTGDWKNGVKHGKGIFKWPDGSKYDGYYINDEREGYGILYWPNGQKYLGLWKQGLFHGNGQIIKPNGTSIRGKWIKGKRIQSKLNTNASGKTKTSQID